MCLILFAIDKHPDFPLILVANRDEYYARPSRPLHWWQGNPHLLGGLDLEGGGSWLAINRKGCLAAVTNYREAGTNLPHRPSRGHLVRDYLRNRHSDWENWLQTNAQSYNGFNLIYGRWDRLDWFSNRAGSRAALGSAIYGLCNNLLDTPWPKVIRGKQLLQQTIQQQRLDPNDLLKILQDDHPAADNNLPDTGIGHHWEQLLSPIFIRSEHYGTRASTVLLIDRQQHALIKERNWDKNGGYSDRQLRFDIEP